jgi:hypothetical protein
MFFPSGNVIPNNETVEPPTLIPEPQCPELSKYPYKVYLCHDSVAMAIENTLNDTVQLYLWLNEGVKDIHTMTSKAFQIHECHQKYKGRALESNEQLHNDH